jgi:hypothetical protein
MQEYAAAARRVRRDDRDVVIDDREVVVLRRGLPERLTAPPGLVPCTKLTVATLVPPSLCTTMS